MNRGLLYDKRIALQAGSEGAIHLVGGWPERLRAPRRLQWMLTNRKGSPVRTPIAVLTLLVGALLFIGTFTVTPYNSTATAQDVGASTLRKAATSIEEARGQLLASYEVTPGTYVDRGFVVDNVLHAGDLGDIHYSLLVPESYDVSRPVALFVTLPAEPGLYYQGAGANLRVEEFAFTAQAYDANMIVCAPQPNDWEQTSADQVVELTEYLLATYDIDPERVYIEGYSYGGETLSLVMGTKPELYRAALHCASQWDGGVEALAEARVPLRISLGDDDEFYTVQAAQEVIEELRTLYRAQGLTEDEIDHLVMLDVKDASYFAGWDGGQHGSGSPLMARDPEVLGWLFAQ